MADAGTSRARYRRILRFAARYMVQAWWFELFLPRIGLSRLAARGRAARLQRLARRFHALAVSLGGLMIKVGQFMSSRLDVLPPEITKELEGLQDEVPPVDFAAIRALAEAELGAPLESVFASIDPVPVAAASRTISMPLPPPPALGLTSSGYPIPAAWTAISASESPAASNPGTTGTPRSETCARERALSPMISSALTSGPMNTRPSAAHASARATLSERNPYPG